MNNHLTTHSYTDPLLLAQELIRCRSMTPVSAAALDRLESTMTALGFLTWRIPFSTPGTLEVDNLYARWGRQGHNFCFAGHVDVVPPGQGWTVDPFSAVVRDSRLFGRGAVDMKGAIACFVAAVARILECNTSLPGSVSLLITGDEEGLAINGTRKVLTWLCEHGERLDACLVGEPTNPDWLGEMMKIGRRGSFNAQLHVFGTQGHAAYPHLTDNPIDRLLAMLAALRRSPLDNGSVHFQPSTLTLTSLDVDNASPNVIPAEARAAFNIRFNDLHTGAALEDWIRFHCDAVGGTYTLSCTLSGDSFLSTPGPLVQIVHKAVYAVTGHAPVLSTSGGTSDARFIKEICPVVEFGLVGRTMHKIDESTSLADLEALTEIYRQVLHGYFAA
ncbi:N-succinyl-L,L-diaminopimelate desuccinylase [invertebrate metagenome]|uniref:Succinyl-diaminopimelate desuccinylase n=1 Tax=invertebrate metagenome TaxID=1711999 RepID=A0A484H7K0_9ZZZZ